MAAVVIGVRMLLLGSGWSPLARLVVEILVGIPAYTAPLYLLHGQRVRAALAGLRNARSSGVAA
jgi:hypothetical protein